MSPIWLLPNFIEEERMKNNQKKLNSDFFWPIRASFNFLFLTVKEE